MKNQDLGITVKKNENISEWYTQVMQKADMADYTSVSGCIVFKPKSYAIWEKIVAAVDKQFKADGIQNAYFPLFIPESLLEKESTHLEGFTPEVAWVTHSGNTKLSERLAVRPTSETIMYESYAKWIRSWRDLPLRLNQWNNVVRWEFKNPVPFLRTREFLWNEGHTVFATEEEAIAEGDVIIDIYSGVMEQLLAIPSLIGKKTELEKFAGAEYTISLEHFLPSGKAIQGPDFHHDGQIFSKAFGISFLDKDEQEKFVWQNTFAITTRVIGIMLMMHGDDKGLIIPPRVAQIQIGVVPIFRKDDTIVLEKSQEIAHSIRDAGFSVKLDDREGVTPGFKFNDLEMNGVPLRVEIGPKDIEQNSVIVVRRDTGEKLTISMDNLISEIPKLLDSIHEELFSRAKHLLESNIVQVESFDALKEAIANKKLVKALYCNNPKSKCEEQIKAETSGATARNIPLGQEPVSNGKCVYCGDKAEYYTYFAKGY